MKKYLKITLTVLAIIWLTLDLAAQRFGHNAHSSYDTIKVKGNRFAFIGEDVYYITSDTIFIVPDTIEFHVRRNNMDRTDSFYKNIETKMSKSRASSLMYDLLFKGTNDSKPHKETSSAQRFTPYDNERIDQIKYKSLNVFGSSINDTTKNKENKWTKPFNRSHINTRKWVIKKNLQFEINNKVDGESMVDSERILRRLDYIKDARIFIDESKKGQGSDVIVATRDVFPYNVLWKPNNDNGALFGISNINIGGIGHELEYDYIEDGGSEFFYRIRNIEKTFIDSEINFSNHFRKSGIGVSLSKDFVTDDTKFAGGLTINEYEYGEVDYNYINEESSAFKYELHYRDLWLAKASETSIVSSKLGFGDQTQVVISGRLQYYDFENTPVVSAEQNYRLHDRTNVLFGLGLSSRTYYKDKFILQYGRTEDVPTGSTLWMVMGRQLRQFVNRSYIGFNYARGGYLNKFGYLNTIYSIGSFFNKDGFSDGVFKVGADYFTKLFTLNQYKFRQFVKLSFAQTIDPSEEVILRSQNDIGVRGIGGAYLLATSKLNINLESLLFTPVSVIGFKMAVFGFMDYTVVSNHKNDFFKTQDFMGFGGGIRLRNDNLAFSTIQLRFGYYPKTPDNSSSNFLGFSTSTRLRIRDFNFQAPEVISFR